MVSKIVETWLDKGLSISESIVVISLRTIDIEVLTLCLLRL